MSLCERNERIFLLMGVSGSGKSTFGVELEKKTGCKFYDGDDFHPEENKNKMARGVPLNDEDRRVWLQIIRDLIQQKIKAKECCFIACSALKKSYRQMLRQSDNQVVTIYLKGSYELIEKRLLHRKGHFMPTSLLKSQFETLEEPNQDEENVFVVDISKSVSDVVNDIIQNISSK
eukprot:TRINITY_DN5649_c0_g2_i1.p1 TRINITY_DN5649_c0_g2~~TRINITY_DN5649_c0_g2_i1.p1  ORF type:complete len:190 (+),score=32.33 TRINITY_DN5649_c0_g2_i1:48-572(+)